MDNRSEVREFLISRRARISPQQAGLPAYGGNRRVTGLRRAAEAGLRERYPDASDREILSSPGPPHAGRRDC